MKFKAENYYLFQFKVKNCNALEFRNYSHFASINVCLVQNSNFHSRNHSQCSDGFCSNGIASKVNSGCEKKFRRNLRLP